MTNKVPREHVEQVTFLGWFAENYPGVKILAIPNGGYRHPNEAVKLKIEGVLKGVPDLFIPEWNLWIEMKRISGSKILREQAQFADYVRDVCGHSHIFAFGWQDAVKRVERFHESKTRSIEAVERG